MKHKGPLKTPDPLSKTRGGEARKASDTIINLTAVPKSFSQRSTPFPSSPPVPSDEDSRESIENDPLAKAINNLADKSAAVIEDGERRDKSRDRRDLLLVGTSVSSTLIAVSIGYAIYTLVAPLVPALTAFDKTMGSWETKAEDSMQLLRESEARQQSMELELANTTEINRDLAGSVSALIESQVETDFHKKKMLAKKAEQKAVNAAGKAAKARIEKAKRSKTAPHPKALREYRQLKEKAAALKREAPPGTSELEEF